MRIQERLALPYLLDSHDQLHLPKESMEAFDRRGSRPLSRGFVSYLVDSVVRVVSGVEHIRVDQAREVALDGKDECVNDQDQQKVSSYMIFTE